MEGIDSPQVGQAEKVHPLLQKAAGSVFALVSFVWAWVL